MLEIDVAKALQGTAGPMRLEVRADIAGGSLVALFGPSGAGKTTLLRLLAGLERPDAGRIAVGGEVWFDAQKRINLPPQHRSIGFMFQDYALFPNLTVRGNVAYGTAPGASAWVDELLDLVGLAALQDRYPATLSGGQKQRVALARALARKPALLLLDEPLSALDAELRSQMQDDLARLHDTLGLTTLLVSHDLGEVFRLSQQVLRLEQGRVVQAGTPAQLFLRERHAGKLNLRAQVLAIRREEVVHLVSLSVGREIVEVVASEDEVRALCPGAWVTISAKTFGALLVK